MKSLKKKEKLIQFFIHETIPDNDEIGKYLIELSFDETIKGRNIFADLGLKILKRSNNYEYILDYLLKIGDIPRAIDFINENSSKLDYKQLATIFLKHEEMVGKNKELLLNYIN